MSFILLLVAGMDISFGAAAAAGPAEGLVRYICVLCPGVCRLWDLRVFSLNKV